MRQISALTSCFHQCLCVQQGAKLTNIFSLMFKVECVDMDRKLYYSQVWRNNMSVCEPPTIRKWSKGDSVFNAGNFTKLTFVPDLKRLGGLQSLLETDSLALMERRVRDTGANSNIFAPGVEVPKNLRPLFVYWNGENVTCPVMEDYAELFLPAPPFVPDEEEAVDAAIDSDESSSDDEATGAAAPVAAAPPKRKARTKKRGGKEGTRFVTCQLSAQWELFIGIRPGLSAGAKRPGHQMSFVNGVWTSDGGTHVTLIQNQLVNAIQKWVEDHKKKGTSRPTRGVILNQVFLYINALVPNPAFKTQSKEELTTVLTIPKSKKPIPPELLLPEDMLEKLCTKTILLDEILAIQEWTEDKVAAGKLDGTKHRRIVGLPKLVDAELASTKRGHECTLVLLEGDSAKGLLLSGLDQLGRDKHGVYPVRGVVKNVDGLPFSKVIGKGKNEEITNIIQIIGLEFGKEYNTEADLSGVRYGHVMIMTDQDHDGHHIKGLLINIFMHWWPSILRIPGYAFLLEFITPIYIVKRQGNLPAPLVAPLRTAPALAKAALQRAAPLVKGMVAKVSFDTPWLSVQTDTGVWVMFYTDQDVDIWKKTPQGRLEGWVERYYKGLGTSDAAHMRVYCAHLSKHRRTFEPMTAKDERMIQIAFGQSKEWLALRKGWLARRGHNAPPMDYSGRTTTHYQFIDRGVGGFADEATERAVPCGIDGNKPVQRKVTHYLLLRPHQRGLRKVVQLAGSVSHDIRYHHGESGIIGAIFKMGQDFVGANNLNILEPQGIFGTRNQCGKDHANGKYPDTRLQTIATTIYVPEDRYILPLRLEEGYLIEPRFYIPIIPMVLVNGSAGMGVGWSTKIPMYSPIDLVDRLFTLLADEDAQASASTIPVGVDVDDEAMREVQAEIRNSEVPEENVEHAADPTILAPGGAQPPYDMTQAVRDLARHPRSKTLIDRLGPLCPWTRGFQGTMHRVDAKRFIQRGVYHQLDATTIEITEIPCGVKMDNYRIFLEKLVDEGKVQRIREHHTNMKICYRLECTPEQMTVFTAYPDLYKFLHLEKSMSLKNMVMFDAKGTLRRYETPEDIVLAYFDERLMWYGKRKEYLIEKLRYDAEKLHNKVRYIELIIAGKIKTKGVSHLVLLEQLARLGFDRRSVETERTKWALGNDEPEEEDEEEEEEVLMVDEEKVSTEAPLTNKRTRVAPKLISGKKVIWIHPQTNETYKLVDYAYLHQMTHLDETQENVAHLRKLIDHSKQKMVELMAIPVTDMWRDDLERFLRAWEKYYAEWQKEFNSGKKVIATEGGKKRAVRRRAPK